MKSQTFADGGVMSKKGEEEQLKHRLSMIEDDIEAIREFIKDKGLEDTFEKNTSYGESANTSLNNIEIACDINDEESLRWGIGSSKNELQQLKHRLLMIQDDLNVIKEFIKNNGLEDIFEEKTSYSDSANTHINNIEIASDICDDEALSWKKFSKKFADGGLMADGGQFDYGFTIRGMNETLRSKFPDSFGFSVYPLDNNYTAGTLKRGETQSYKGLSDADVKSKLYFPQYKRDHEINYHIKQGGENTYFDFLLEDENGKGYVGTFGFKDQGDVPASYITGFIAFLQEAYGLPFTIEHTVK